MTDFRINVILDPRQATQGVRAVGKGLDGVERKAARVGSELKRAFGIVGLGAGLALGVNLLAGFSQEMSTVGAITRATGLEFQSLQDEAARLGITTRFSASEAAAGMTFLARAGFEANEVLASVGDTLLLAQAGALGLAEAADIASNVLQGFRLGAEQAGRVVDVLALAANSSNTNVSQLGQAMKFAGPVAAGLGVSVEEAAAAIGALSNAGLQATLAGTGLRKVMAELESPSNRTAEILSMVGLTADDVRVSSVGLTGALEALTAAGVDTGQALELFGVRGGPAFEVLSSSIGDVRRMTNELGNAAGTAERVATAMDDNLRGALLATRSAFQGFFLALGEAGTTDALEGAFRALAGTLRFLASEVDTLVSALIAAGGAFVALKIAPAIAGFVALEAAIGSGTAVLIGSAEATRQQAVATVAAAAADVAKTEATLASLAAESARAAVVAGSTEAMFIQNTVTLQQTALEATLTTQTASLSAAQVLLGISTKKAAFESLFFGRVLKSLFGLIAKHPIGAVVVAVGALAGAMVAFIPDVESASDATKRFRGELIDLEGAVGRLEGLRAEGLLLEEIGGTVDEFQSNLQGQVRALEGTTARLLRDAQEGQVSIKISDLIGLAPGLDQDLVDGLIAKGKQAADEALAKLEDAPKREFNLAVGVAEGFEFLSGGLLDLPLADVNELADSTARAAAIAVQGNVKVTDAVRALTEALKRQRAELAQPRATDDPARVAGLQDVADGLALEERLLGLTGLARERANEQLKIEEGLRENQIELDGDERGLLRDRLAALQALADQSDVLESIIGPQEDFNRTQAALKVLLDESAISAEEYAIAMSDAEENLGGFEQSIAALNSELEAERMLIGASRVEREQVAEVLRIEQELRRQLSEEEEASVRALVAERAELAAVAEVYGSLNTGQEQFMATQVALNTLLENGAISAGQYTEALRLLQGTVQDTENTMSGGFSDGIEKVRKQFGDVSGQVEGTVVNAFGAAEDALVSFVATGELNFSSFVDGIISDLARLLARKALLSLIDFFAPGVGTGLGIVGAGAGPPTPSSLGATPAATGADAFAGQNFLVGEEGPELFTPPQAGTIVPAGETAAALAASMTPEAPTVNTTVEVNPNIINVSDPDEIPAAIESGAADTAIINRLGRNRRAVKGMLS